MLKNLFKYALVLKEKSSLSSSVVMMPFYCVFSFAYHRRFHCLNVVRKSPSPLQCLYGIVLFSQGQPSQLQRVTCGSQLKR